MNPIDKFLNNITMYKQVNFGLFGMAFYALILSFFGLVSFKPLELVASFFVLTMVCYTTNLLLGKLFQATLNAESSSITALILFFLLWPSTKPQDLLVIGLAGALAMASKFVFAYKKKHIFNPAAIACVLLLFVGSGAVWWIGTVVMLPYTLIFGLLVVRKIRRFQMFFAFLTTCLIVFLSHVLLKGFNPADELYTFFVSFPVIFFGTIMFTEPLTTPPTRKLQFVYAGLVGFLFAWQGPFGPIILTTELALVFGNVFAFIVSPKFRLYLHLGKKTLLAKDTYEFSFPKPANFTFKPGQYLEWTVPDKKSDSRGNRRYFTIASSPTEPDLKLGIKFNTPPSTFKKTIQEIEGIKTITAGNLSGDFTLPQKQSEKLVFIAGGIGVTPFRSMAKYLMDKKEKRDIVFFYANKTEDEIAYRNEFDNAISVGVKMVYLLSEEENLSKNWSGEKGRITVETLNKHIPDLKSRTFYISGPVGMVESYKKLLASLGIRPTQIHTDYFPGF